MSAPDALTDLLASVLASQHRVRSLAAGYVAPTLSTDLRAALADGSLPLRAVLPPEVADVLTAAVAYHEAWLRASRRHGEERMHLLAETHALPEHLRAALADGGEA